MNGIEQLKRRTDALAPAAPGNINQAASMSDEEIDRRARAILAGNTDHIDPAIVKKAREIMRRNATVEVV